MYCSVHVLLCLSVNAKYKSPDSKKTFSILLLFAGKSWRECRTQTRTIFSHSWPKHGL